MAVVIPITGFLLQRFSTRPVFLTAMSPFCVGTLLAGLAPGSTLLVLAVAALQLGAARVPDVGSPPRVPLDWAPGCALRVRCGRRRERAFRHAPVAR